MRVNQENAGDETTSSLNSDILVFDCGISGVTAATVAAHKEAKYFD